MSIRLYVGNLPEEVSRQELEAVFMPSEQIVSIKVITDRKTGKCRGFGFLTVTTPEAAEEFIEKFNGTPFKETTLRVEKAQPKAKTDRSDAETTSQMGEVEVDGQPSDSEETPAPAEPLTPRPIAIRKTINKGRTERPNKPATGGRRETVTTPQQRSGGDEATQPDPRWADALRDIRKQLSKA
ncbi:MAG: RNA-binding protein [Gemmatimonadaceae bacterium]|nr:RNA-binding protein [Gloeobacterales cyanobacterium ES-bin-141]